MATKEATPISICRDEDCPECEWPETYAAGTMENGPDRIGCRKCGWTQKLSLTDKGDR